MTSRGNFIQMEICYQVCRSCEYDGKSDNEAGAPGVEMTAARGRVSPVG